MTITYNSVSAGDIIDANRLNKIKDDLERGITAKVGIGNGAIFKNVINLTGDNTQRIINNVGDADLNRKQDAINLSQNRTGLDKTGLDIGSIILFHGDKIPVGWARCDGKIPKECPLQLTTPILKSLIKDVHYIIRIL